MSDNPRLFLAGFWCLAGLDAFTAAVNSHSAFWVVLNIGATIWCPVFAYFELRRGLAERKARVHP